MDTWAAKSANVPDGTVTEVLVDGRRVALARVEGKLYAVDGACPHRGGDLGRGDLSGHHLYCPEHAWAFDLRDGAAFFPKGARIACFAVREEDGEIFIEIPAGQPPAWRPPDFADR
jgi:nitrite reductase/ring-hydroxylating ferredoxin subunit